MIRQVAKYLGIKSSQIRRCEEWFTVLFVIAKGCSPTFVSKKIFLQPPQFFPGDVVVSHAGCCYKVVKTTDSRVRCYPINVSLSERRKSQEQFIFPAEQLTIITSSYPVIRGKTRENDTKGHLDSVAA